MRAQPLLRETPVPVDEATCAADSDELIVTTVRASDAANLTAVTGCGRKPEDRADR